MIHWQMRLWDISAFHELVAQTPLSGFSNESFYTGTVFRLEFFVHQNNFVGMQKKRFEHIDMSREKALLEFWYYPVFDAEWKRNIS